MPDQMPVYLFSYGTLQQPEIQLSSFGRLLHGEEDAMTGYQASMMEITDAAVIKARANAFILLFTRVTIHRTKSQGKSFASLNLSFSLPMLTKCLATRGCKLHCAQAKMRGSTCSPDQLRIKKGSQ